MELSVSLSDILIGVITLIAAGLGYVIKEQRDKIKSIQDQLSEKKYGLYNEIFSIFFDLLKGQKGLKQSDHSDLPGRIIDIKKDLFIYAPDEVANKFIEWTRFISNNTGDLKHAGIYLELFVLIRKDMGHSKTKLTEEDFLKAIMTTDEEVWQMKKLIGK